MTTSPLTVAPVLVIDGTPVHTMEQVRRVHRQVCEVDWFAPDAMSFFGTRLGRTLHAGRFFITSEQPPSGERAYSVREVMEDGRIETVGEFMGHPTKADAEQAIGAECARRGFRMTRRV